MSALHSALTGTTSAAFKMVESAGRNITNQAKLRAPVDKGVLRNSHVQRATTITGWTVEGGVDVTANYAAAVHEGSKPHMIRPRRAKFLSWNGPAGRVFAREVHHPGAQARPWLRNAATEEGTRLGFTVN